MKSRIFHSLQSRRFSLYILTFAVAVISCYLRYGYSFGVHDQWVLSPKGISLANPDAFANDWFTQSAPQPHWAFDGITYFGEKFGLLHQVYFVYWLLTCWVAAVFFVWFFDWIRKPWLAILGPPLLALGPVSLLGSGSIVWGWALPHCLGGCLAVAAIVAWMTERYLWCNFLLLAATVVHVQHGAHAAGIIIVMSLLFGNFRKTALGALASLLSVYLIARSIGLSSNSEMVLTACEKYIPGHCLATSWPAFLFVPALFLTLGVVFAFFIKNEIRGKFFLTILFVGFGLYLGITLDLLNLDSISWLPRRFNIYRLVSILEPLSIMGFVAGLSDFTENLKNKKFQLISIYSVSFFALLSWLISSTSSFQNEIWKALLTSLVLLFSLICFEFDFLPQLRLGKLALFFSLIPIYFSLPFANSADIEALRSIGKEIGRRTPPGSLILAAPNFVWLRFFTRRAVIADLKAIPYQLDQFKEWEQRIRDMGGFDYEGDRYAHLNFQQWEYLVFKYNPQYALVTETEKSASEILKKYPLQLTIESNPKLYLVKTSLPDKRK